MSRIRLTPALEQLILAGIRAGGFAQISAEAAGIGRETFERWLRIGQRNKKQPYRSFFEKVRQAVAQARLRAEMDVREKDVRFWLRYGPGKETVDTPGWSAPPKPVYRSDRPVHSRDLQLLGTLLLDALQPYPEARRACHQALKANPDILRN
jgi:hypothetical protein